MRFQNEDATREASDLYGGEGGSVALRRELGNLFKNNKQGDQNKQGGVK